MSAGCAAKLIDEINDNDSCAYINKNCPKTGSFTTTILLQHSLTIKMFLKPLLSKINQYLLLHIPHQATCRKEVVVKNLK